MKRTKRSGEEEGGMKETKYSNKGWMKMRKKSRPREEI